MGLLLGAVRPRRFWMHYVGVLFGQLIYMLLFLPLGPLIVIGLVFLRATRCSHWRAPPQGRVSVVWPASGREAKVFDDKGKKEEQAAESGRRTCEAES